MGNDGGSIPKRRELVKEAVRTQSAAEAKESQQEQQGHRWTTCALSQQPLQAPVVSDWRGTLYNKDAILEFLLAGSDDDKDDAGSAAAKADAAKVLAGRVASLKDVVEVKFHEEGEDANSTSPTWVCPITHKQLGPGVKAAYIVPCGHAFSEIALKEVAELVCLQCNEPYAASNIVTILPLKDEDKARLQQRIDTLKAEGLTHSLKKAAGTKKKRKHMHAETSEVASATAAANGKSTTNGSNGNGGGGGSGIKNAATASLTAKVLAEEEAKAKRRKADTNANATLKTLFTAGDKKRADTGFMTRGYSIPAAAKR